MSLHFYTTAQHSDKIKCYIAPFTFTMPLPLFYHIFLSVFTNVNDLLHSVALIKSHNLFDFDKTVVVVLCLFMNFQNTDLSERQ